MTYPPVFGVGETEVHLLDRPAYVFEGSKAYFCVREGICLLHMHLTSVKNRDFCSKIWLFGNLSRKTFSGSGITKNAFLPQFDRNLRSFWVILQLIFVPFCLLHRDSSIFQEWKSGRPIWRTAARSVIWAYHLLFWLVIEHADLLFPERNAVRNERSGVEGLCPGGPWKNVRVCACVRSFFH